MYCGVPSEDPEQLVALVLAGGQSTRMGKDKGMLIKDGETWIQRAGKCCESLGLTVYYSLNAVQREDYVAIVPQDRMVVDALEIKGPLAGLLSFYIQHPEQDVLLFPCDMIEMNAEVLQLLVKTYQEVNIGHDVVVFQHEDDNIEPMPGIYTAEFLKKIYWLYTSGELEKHSLKYTIDISNSFFKIIPKGKELFFLNVNSHDDLINITSL